MSCDSSRDKNPLTRPSPLLRNRRSSTLSPPVEESEVRIDSWTEFGHHHAIFGFVTQQVRPNILVHELRGRRDWLGESRKTRLCERGRVCGEVNWNHVRRHARRIEPWDVQPFGLGWHTTGGLNLG